MLMKLSKHFEHEAICLTWLESNPYGVVAAPWWCRHHQMKRYRQEVYGIKKRGRRSGSRLKERGHFDWQPSVIGNLGEVIDGEFAVEAHL